MKIVHTKDKITLEMRLNETLKRNELLKVVQASHSTYRVEEKWLWFWKPIATIDVYREIIHISASNWKRFEAHITLLATVIEAHYTLAREHSERIKDMTIEVRP